MAGKTTLIVVALLFSVLPLVTADDAGGQRIWRPVLGIGVQGAVAVADEPVGSGYPAGFFTPKAQAVGAISVSLDLPVFPGISLGLGLQLHGATASNPAGGWTYRAHWGGAIRVSAGYGSELSRPCDALRLSLGACAGGSFNFDLMTFTTLFFYYPGIFLEPYLQLDHSRRKKSSVALVLPIDYYFRRDLEFYGSIGLGVVWRYARK
jgi:hypothetical protein